MVIRLIAAIALLSLFGCASGYKPNGLFNGGFSSTQLSANTFTVRFKGNEYTSPERAADFALLRSAEIADKHGFSWIEVLNEQASTTTSSTGMPVFGAGGNVFGGSIVTEHEPEQTYKIRCHHDNIDDSPSLLKVSFLLQSLRSKYKLQASNALNN